MTVEDDTTFQWMEYRRKFLSYIGAHRVPSSLVKQLKALKAKDGIAFNELFARWVVRERERATDYWVVGREDEFVPTYPSPPRKKLDLLPLS